MVATQQSITNSMTVLAAAQTQAEQYAKILSTPIKGSPTAAQVAQLQQAILFFQAMEHGGTYTTPTGTVIDFSQFGNSGGIFGNQTSTFVADLNKVLNDYGNTVTIPSPNGGTVTVMDATTGKPATLADLVANPNHTFSFSFSDHMLDTEDGGVNVNWCQGGSFYNAFKGPCVNGTGSGSITTDANGNPIPGNGLNVDVTSHNSACSGSTTVTVSGSGQDLLNYVKFSPGGTSASLGADGVVLSQFLNQYM